MTLRGAQGPSRLTVLSPKQPEDSFQVENLDLTGPELRSAATSASAVDRAAMSLPLEQTTPETRQFLEAAA